MLVLLNVRSAHPTTLVSYLVCLISWEAFTLYTTPLFGVQRRRKKVVVSLRNYRKKIKKIIVKMTSTKSKI